MEKEFLPPKRTGIWVLLVLLLGVIAGILYVLSAASQAAQQTVFMANLLAAVVLIAVGIWLLLRMHTLFTTRYMLSRGGLELRWGLRREVIPMSAVQWIRSVTDFQTRLPRPVGALPGMIFGARNVPGLGPVEYAASDSSSLLLVAASGRYFAISPRDPETFLGLYERLSELGSLVSYEPHSESLDTLRKKIWQDKIARGLLGGGFAAGLLVLALASALAGSRAEITWTTLEQVGSSQVFLLAFFSLFIWLLNFGVGLYFYLRGGMEKAMIYLLWAGSILTSLLLAAAMLILAL
jgi:hypothetical protein